MNSGGLGLIAAAVGAAFASGAIAEPCEADRVSLRHNGSVASFTVEIADTDAERSQGLMFREELARFSGMLFVYDAPRFVQFWMKNTPLPLDLLFVDETGTVTRIGRDAVPFSEAVIPGGDGILMVLEVNGGTADKLGLSEGTQMRHPMLDQSVAVWPCETG